MQPGGPWIETKLSYPFFFAFLFLARALLFCCRCGQGQNTLQALKDNGSTVCMANWRFNLAHKNLKTTFTPSRSAATLSSKT